MQGGLLLLLLLPVAGSQPCNPAARFPYNWSGIETSGLSSSPNATTAAQCAAACCASQSCTTWQFCPAATSCGSATQGPSCWTGDATLPKYSAGGWVGAAALPLPSDRAVTLSRNPVPMPIPLCPPVTNPATGDTLSVDTLSLRINGQPILPVSGEMHPSRVPVASWRSDLMRMKAGGVSLVYAYIMWLHTEEVQGQPDFGGNRNVTLFLQTAKEVGLLVALRIGPWDHGECRNGGLPDWVLEACQSGGFKCRNNNTGFMSLTQRQYTALAQAMQGYGYEEGGPLVIIQVDNEISDVEYLEALKDMGVALGMKPAFWVKTGWPAPSTPVPYGSLLPLFGGYPDDFWSGIQDTSYGNFLFNSNPNPAPLPPNTAADDAEPYPFFTVEVGGGMASSYHRRIFIDPEDVTAQALVFYGSGVASLGFYMYHGGTDPMGQLSTFQESQLTGYPNDLPIRTYDFHAPIGEAGQPRPHFHGIRALGALSAAWGHWLAPMPSYRPGKTPSGPTDTATLRMAVRSDGSGGLIFLNNRNIHVNMSAQAAVSATLQLADGSQLRVPSLNSTLPTLPAGSYGAWAFNLPLPHAPAASPLLYATASPFTSLPGTPLTPPTLVLHLPTGVPTGELALNATSRTTGAQLVISHCSGACSLEGGVLYARALAPGLAPALTLAEAATPATPVLQVLLLDAPTAARAWAAEVGGQPRLLLSDSATSYLLPAVGGGGGGLALATEGVGAAAQLWVLPAPSAVLLTPTGAALPGVVEGAFTRYTLDIPPGPITAGATLLAPAAPARVIPLGPSGHAQAPSADGALGAFEGAEVHAVTLAGGQVDPEVWEVRLRVVYAGDCARLYAGASTDRGAIAMDHFFNGHPMELPLTRAGFSAADTFTLRLLPLAKNVASERFPWGPVMFEALPAFNASGVAVGLESITAVHTYTAQLTFVA